MFLGSGSLPFVNREDAWQAIRDYAVNRITFVQLHDILENISPRAVEHWRPLLNYLLEEEDQAAAISAVENAMKAQGFATMSADDPASQGKSTSFDRFLMIIVFKVLQTAQNVDTQSLLRRHLHASGVRYVLSFLVADLSDCLQTHRGIAQRYLDLEARVSENEDDGEEGEEEGISPVSYLGSRISHDSRWFYCS